MNHAKAALGILLKRALSEADGEAWTVTSEVPEEQAGPITIVLSAHEWAILARIVGLSSREAVVFALIGEGHRPKAVAGLLDSSVKTVETHIERIRSRLGGARGPVQGDDLVFLARIWARSRKA